MAPRAKKTKGATKNGQTIAFVITDAKNMLKQAKKPAVWARMQKKGVKASERDHFEQTIKQAEARDKAATPVSLEDIREPTKDLIGAYRDAADLVSSNFDGTDTELRKDLRMVGEFPSSDREIAAYLDGLPAIMREHSDALASRDFSKKQQADLAKAGADFIAALGAKSEKRSEVAAANQEREVLFKRLRIETAYFRKAGRSAYKNTKDRVLFDRVQPASTGKKTAAARAAARAAKKKAGETGGETK